MSLTRTLRYYALRLRRFVIYRILRVDDTPHRIALGVAVGVWVTFTPTIGIQTLLCVAICQLLRANKVVGLPFIWISNPATLVPIYYPSYVLGSLMLGRRPKDGWAAITSVLQQEHGGWMDEMRAGYTAIAPIFAELCLGSVVVATAMGIGSYFAARKLVIAYRARRSRRARARWTAKAGPEERGDVVRE